MQSNSSDTGGIPATGVTREGLGKVRITDKRSSFRSTQPESAPYIKTDLTELPEGVTFSDLAKMLEWPTEKILNRFCNCPFSAENEAQIKTDPKWHVSTCPYLMVLQALYNLSEQEELLLDRQATQDRRPKVTIQGMQLLRQAIDRLYQNNFDAALDLLVDLTESDTEQILTILNQLGQIVGAVGTQHQLVKVIERKERPKQDSKHGLAGGSGPIHVTIHNSPH
jgi:hypothetical protein